MSVVHVTVGFDALASTGPDSSSPARAGRWRMPPARHASAFGRMAADAAASSRQLRVAREEARERRDGGGEAARLGGRHAAEAS